MGFQIQDGTGSSKKVKVSISNKLFTESVIRSEREEEALLGEAYIVGTGFVTLTSATQSSVLYFKNNEDERRLRKESTGTPTSFLEVCSSL